MFADMGIVDEAIRAGTRSHGVNIYNGTNRLLHVSYDDLESPYPFLLNIPQSGTEKVLGGLVKRLGLEIEWRTELLGFTQDDEGVTATLRHPDGQSETVRAAWLVGCDGAHSIVRHVLDIPFAGHTYSQWFGLADARVQWSLGHDELHGFVHPRGLFFAIPEPGEQRFRVVMESEEPPAGTDLTLAHFQAALDERGPGNATLSDPGWISPFKVNARRAERYRVGRVFIAGDAAHIHSPTGGLGLNTGMQDSYNLAWKLALVVRGMADPALLDSYQIERIPVADAVLRLAGNLTMMLTLTNPMSRELRDHLMPILNGLGAVRHEIAVEDAQLSITYGASPIVSEYHHERFGHLKFAGGPRAGDRAPDAGPLAGGASPVRLYELLRGTHHTWCCLAVPSRRRRPCSNCRRSLARCPDSLKTSCACTSSSMEKRCPRNWLGSSVCCWTLRGRCITVTRRMDQSCTWFGLTAISGSAADQPTMPLFSPTWPGFNARRPAARNRSDAEGEGQHWLSLA